MKKLTVLAGLATLAGVALPVASFAANVDLPNYCLGGGLTTGCTQTQGVNVALVKGVNQQLIVFTKSFTQGDPVGQNIGCSYQALSGNKDNGTYNLLPVRVPVAGVGGTIQHALTLSVEDGSVGQFNAYRGNTAPGAAFIVVPIGVKYTNKLTIGGKDYMTGPVVNIHCVG